MLLLEQDYRWTPQDAQHDVPFVFTCPAGTKEVRLYFTFSPGKETTDDICRPAVEQALKRYYDRYPRELQPMQADQFLPVKNLITISLDKDGQYIGNAHRWDTNQEHILTTQTASRGFTPPDRLDGPWGGMLHLHEIISPVCRGTLRIEGRLSDEVVSG